MTFQISYQSICPRKDLSGFFMTMCLVQNLQGVYQPKAYFRQVQEIIFKGLLHLYHAFELDLGQGFQVYLGFRLVMDYFMDQGQALYLSIFCRTQQSILEIQARREQGVEQHIFQNESYDDCEESFNKNCVLKQLIIKAILSNGNILLSIQQVQQSYQNLNSNIIEFEVTRLLNKSIFVDNNLFKDKQRFQVQMIQDYKQKFKTLRQNLMQAEQLNKSLKLQLLKLGSECNSLIISVSSSTNRAHELRSLIPQKNKQLYYAKQELKRFQYKTQKLQIKLKEYQQRAKRFEDLHKAKKQKNQTINQKILKLQSKLIQQKQKQNQLIKQLNQLYPKIEPSNLPSLKVQNKYLKNLNNQNNPLDQMQISKLNDQIRTNKLKQEKQELERKNAQLKSNINKLQHKINEIITFLSLNSCIPAFNQQTHLPLPSSLKSTSINQIQNQQTALKYTGKQGFPQKHHILPTSSRVSQNLPKRTSNKLPSHILSSFSDFQNFKSKSILDQLVSKHSQVVENQREFIQNLHEKSLLMTQFGKINSLLESQIADQNNKIATLNIKSKKYIQMHKKSLY